MIAVERHGDGYLVKVKDDVGRYREPAATAQEAANAVLHYYGAPHERGECAFCAASGRAAGREREERAQAAVKEWNRVNAAERDVVVNCPLGATKERTIGSARIVRDGNGRANAMVPIAGTLGLQPVEIVRPK